MSDSMGRAMGPEDFEALRKHLEEQGMITPPAGGGPPNIDPAPVPQRSERMPPWKLANMIYTRYMGFYDCMLEEISLQQYGEDGASSGRTLLQYPKAVSFVPSRLLHWFVSVMPDWEQRLFVIRHKGAGTLYVPLPMVEYLGDVSQWSAVIFHMRCSGMTVLPADTERVAAWAENDYDIEAARWTADTLKRLSEAYLGAVEGREPWRQVLVGHATERHSLMQDNARERALDGRRFFRRDAAYLMQQFTEVVQGRLAWEVLPLDLDEEHAIAVQAMDRADTTQMWSYE